MKNFCREDGKTIRGLVAIIFFSYRFTGNIPPLFKQP
jgi:hypothetical protein